MEFLGIGPLELLVIIILALVIFSPKDIAGGGKAAGRWINRLYKSDTYRSMKQMSQELQDLPNRLARDANLEELKDLEKEVKSAGENLRLDAPPNPPIPAIEKPAAESAAFTKPDEPAGPADLPNPLNPAIDKPNGESAALTKPDGGPDESSGPSDPDKKQPTAAP